VETYTARTLAALYNGVAHAAGGRPDEAAHWLSLVPQFSSNSDFESRLTVRSAAYSQRVAAGHERWPGVLTALELVYCMGASWDAAQPAWLEKALVMIEGARGGPGLCGGARHLASFQRGVVCRCLDRRDEAMAALGVVSAARESLEAENMSFLVPFAMFEMSKLALQNRDIDETRRLLREAKAFPSGYAWQRSLQFRVKAAEKGLRECEE